MAAANAAAAPGGVWPGPRERRTETKCVAVQSPVAPPVAGHHGG